MSVLPNRLREARERKGFSQVYVKDKTGINNKTLSGWENGHSEPDYKSLTTLAKLYEVTVDWLIGENLNPASSEKIYALADPKGWVERLAREFEEKNGFPMSEGTKAAIFALLEVEQSKQK